MYLTNHQ